MSHYHEVRQGECFSSIAAQYGFTSYNLLLDRPENAGLKGRRGGPNVLLPGDRVFIPDKESKEETRATDQKHTFVVKRKRVFLELVLKLNDQAIANTPYKLTVGSLVYLGTTRGDGSLSQEIDPQAENGSLQIEAPPLEWDLAIGSLDPADEVSGIQGRLRNLGFACGPVDGKLGPRTRGALRRFQSDRNLSVTGQADNATRARLKQEAGG